MTHRQPRHPHRNDEILTISASRSQGMPNWTLALGAVALAGAVLLAQPATAGSHGDDHGHQDHGETRADHELADNPAVQAYREANDRMHEGMMGDFTGDADVDFARGMIPHHQGAIDMANIVLEHGEDEAIHDLAREIIEAQEEEIAFLRNWLDERGHDVD